MSLEKFLGLWVSDILFTFSQIKRAIDADSSIKLIFLCSPGNPTGTLIPLTTIRSILDYEKFKGIVVIDEAYIEFSSDASKNSAVSLVKDYANLCVMQTFSKSFGLAAIRCFYFVLFLKKLSSNFFNQSFFTPPGSELQSPNPHLSKSSPTQKHLTTSQHPPHRSHYPLSLLPPSPPWIPNYLSSKHHAPHFSPPSHPSLILGWALRSAGTMPILFWYLF